MTIVDVYSGDDVVWAGAMHDIPASNSVFVLAAQFGEAGLPPAQKAYRVLSCIWSATQDINVAENHPRLQVIEIDPATGQPKQSLIQTPKLTIH